MRTNVLILLILCLFLIHYKTNEKVKISIPVSDTFPDKVATSNGFIFSGYALDTMDKYSKAVSPSSVLYVEVDTIKRNSIVYSVYTTRHDEKKKSLAER